METRKDALRIIGIDPGTHRLGFGVLDALANTPECLEWGCLMAGANTPLHQRLYRFYTDLKVVVDRWRPDHMAVEEPFVNVERGAKSAVALGQAQAIALVLAAEAGMEVFRYAPTQVKRAVADYGAVTKDQLQRMVQLALGVEPQPMPEDASDALAVALCHLRQWSAAERVKGLDTAHRLPSEGARSPSDRPVGGTPRPSRQA